MPLKQINWEELSVKERAALVKAGEHGPLAFTALWFNIVQGDQFQTNWHHHYFDHAARRVLEGKSKATVINIPPGGTKTEFWSVHLPIYCMTQFPQVRILNTSYSKDLVDENSERSRALVKSAEFQEAYGLEVQKDRVDHWTLGSGKRAHELISRSSGGQITGVRGGYLRPHFSGYVMADDWDKVDDLLSETKRKRSQTRLTNVLRSRRAHSSTPFIAVQQRGHVDDSTAYLLRGGMGLTVDQHIQIPALVDQDYIDTLPGPIRDRCIADICHTEQVDGYWSYWPEKENVHDLIALKRAHPYTFQSQYQQAPEQLDGGIFSADGFVTFGDDDDCDIPIPRKYEYRFITADTAQKKNEWNDWSVFAEWGYYQGRIYRLSYERDRMDARELRQRFKNFVTHCWSKNSNAHGRLRSLLVEDKSSGTGLIQELQGHLPLPVTPVPRDKDKVSRAFDVSPHQLNGRVALPSGDEQNYEFIAEVSAFSHDDSHKHDDQTDVMIDAIDHAILGEHVSEFTDYGSIV